MTERTVFTAVLVMVALLAACGGEVPPIATPSDDEPAITSLGQGDSFTAEITSPALFIAGSRTGTEPFARWLEPGHRQRLDDVDYDADWVVAAFHGGAPSTGYGMEILSVRPAGDTVDVVVEITDPPTDRAQSDVETYAYHVALVSKDDLPSGASWHMVTTDGHTVTETQPSS